MLTLVVSATWWSHQLETNKWSSIRNKTKTLHLLVCTSLMLACLKLTSSALKTTCESNSFEARSTNDTLLSRVMKIVPTLLQEMKQSQSLSCKIILKSQRWSKLNLTNSVPIRISIYHQSFWRIKTRMGSFYRIKVTASKAMHPWNRITWCQVEVLSTDKVCKNRKDSSSRTDRHF